MRAEDSFDGRVLLLKVAERALLVPPDWGKIPGLRRLDMPWVALDLSQVDFISSLFVQACVELAGTLAQRGQELVLLHLTGEQKRVLEFVPGASRLPLFDDVKQLNEAIQSAAKGAPDEGVTTLEKGILWG